MKIGIVGNGVVGSATAHAFRAKHEVRCWDVVPERVDKCHGWTAVDLVKWVDITFVCLPTPQHQKSLRCDTSAVDCVLATLSGSKSNLVLRSTVPIGYTRRVREQYDLPNLVHSPEFLTARTAKEDAVSPTRLLIGSSEGCNTCAGLLDELYRQTWYDRTIAYSHKPSLPIMHMPSDESEAVKLMQNAFSSVKVSMFNEMRVLADKHGMNWETVLNALLAGGWINPMHTKVPGPDGKRGFGGACLPKDLANFIQCCDDAGVQRLVSAAALMRNEHFDRVEDYYPDYPCCEAARRIESRLGDASSLVGGDCPIHGKTIHRGKK